MGDHLQATASQHKVSGKGCHWPTRSQRVTKEPYLPACHRSGAFHFAACTCLRVLLLNSVTLYCWWHMLVDHIFYAFVPADLSAWYMEYIFVQVLHIQQWELWHTHPSFSGPSCWQKCIVQVVTGVYSHVFVNINSLDFKKKTIVSM